MLCREAREWVQIPECPHQFWIEMNQGHIGVGVVISVVKVVGQERAGNGKFIRLVVTNKVTDDAFARACARKDNLYFLMEVPIGVVSHLSHGPDADRLVFAVLF